MALMVHPEIEFEQKIQLQMKVSIIRTGQGITKSTDEWHLMPLMHLSAVTTFKV